MPFLPRLPELSSDAICGRTLFAFVSDGVVHVSGIFL